MKTIDSSLQNEIQRRLENIGQSLEWIYNAIGETAEPTIEQPDQPSFPINAEGVQLVKYFEASGDFRNGGNRDFLTAYRDAVGVWTIGYGHTGKTHNDGSVRKGLVIDEQKADELLSADLQYFADKVKQLVKVELNANQFAALVAFAFNLGEGNLASSTLLRRLNAGRYDEAAEQFGRWVYAGKTKLQGLVRRRVAEKLLFLGQDWRDFKKFA
ncbi:MAG: lysozyme [Verrucomicrobiales bacterium]